MTEYINGKGTRWGVSGIFNNRKWVIWRKRRGQGWWPCDIWYDTVIEAKDALNKKAKSKGWVKVEELGNM